MVRTFALLATAGLCGAAVLNGSKATHLKGASIKSGNVDYGSAKGAGNNGGSAQWSYTADRVGDYRVCARYAGAGMDMEFLVNGADATALPLKHTDGWKNWKSACTTAHFSKGQAAVTLRSAKLANAIVDKLTITYVGYTANKDVAASATAPLTVAGQAQESWKGYRKNPVTQTATYKIGHSSATMERLPRDAKTGLPTAAFPREQLGISKKMTRGGVTVRVGKHASRWNDALSDTIISKGKFNAQHVFEPQQNNNYNPHVQKACCMDKCQGAKGCEFGCGTWLSKSSLNWEGTHWFDALSKKCQKDCMAPRLAKNSPNYGGSSVYEEKHFDALTKDKEAGCVKGCKTFRSCMSAVRAN
jgi:hypothetical protein